MKKKSVALIAVSAGLMLSAGLAAHQSVSAHCQIPCGIYDDDLRFGLLKENIATIDKAMKQILELSADPAKNAAQIARWAINKDQYADDIAHIVSAYFLQQRIKPLVVGASPEETSAYLKKLTLCHELMVNAMKAKQTTDAQYVEKLSQLLDQFHEAYSH